MEIPKNIKVVYTFPEDEPGMRADSVGVHGAGKHTKNIHDNKVEILLENVNFNKIGSPADWTNGRQAVGANIRLARERYLSIRIFPLRSTTIRT
ncbi:hypothetical protein FYJ34_00285 [Clostridiaceae bacterium 68-1-5]|uniref:Uncharacterized protein n=1 Tax=Suipraeoptans intestinalis TaxID=2606628 RepID=A0A6N7UR16_9FIRM|nr:hypothetical protein [Suipraeoptans intestinalis]MSR92788.1 hypothetical protein [Suipraeoptans intestinalis]